MSVRGAAGEREANTRAFTAQPVAVHLGTSARRTVRANQDPGRIFHAGLGTTELLIVLVLVLLLFGGTQLPKLARSLGQAGKEFDQGLTFL